MTVTPYLDFEGRCEEAIEFYRTAVGAEVEMLLRFKDNPEAGQSSESCGPDMIPPGSENKIMHASLRIGGSTVMMSDCGCSGQTNFQGISLAVSGRDDEQAARLFASLSDGGQVQMPLTKTFFSSSFGVVADRFGVSWMITVAT